MPPGSDRPRPAAGSPLGIFGGTFDPIHYGHLRTAFELCEALELAELRFIPAGQPPHRERMVAGSEARLAMVRAAIADEPRFRVDERELKKSGPSYTVDTLRSLRDEFPARPLCLVVGMDAFLGLPQWHQWREILSLAHLVVAHRPGWRAPTLGPLGELLVAHGTGVVRDLHAAPAGCIFIHAVTQLEISSTELRSLIHAGRDERYLVPEGVRRIIHETGCYARKERREG
jgi:nicotinate-nucleotide adenylyltransferase